jgi:membrane protein
MRKGVVASKRYVALLTEQARVWSEDYAPSMGAALSYYSLFSIAPLLLIVIGIAGLVFGADAARGAIFGELRGLIGDEGAQAVEGLLQAADKPKQGIVSTIVGLVVLLLGAMTVFGELQNALDRIWRAPAREKASGPWNLLRTRLLSFGMVLGIAFLLMVSLVLSAALAALGKWWGAAFAGWEFIAHLIDVLLSFGLMTVMFALIYRYIPRVRVEWHDVWIGAAVTSLLFAIGKFAIGLYLGKSAVASSFGAAGSLVILMVWVYYSAQIFLFGAEFTWVYAHEFGSRRGQSRPRPETATRQTEPPTQEPAPRHQAFPLPAHAANEPALVREERRSRTSIVRRQHPYASVFIAFVVGSALGIAKGLGAHRAIVRQREGWFAYMKRRWT